jgi:hypothetical protein
MIRLWRRFMAWLDEPDEVTVYIDGRVVEVRAHCATCAKGVRKG